MDSVLKALARKCLDGAYNGTMSFPQILEYLHQNGFESYHIDYLRNTSTYYHFSKGTIELPFPYHDWVVSKDFNASKIQLAVKEAQQNAEGYTYQNFSRKVMESGCAGYFVSILGRRVLYWGRTAEFHVEYFPR